MVLSNDLISQFVQITKSDTKTKSDVTRYGTVKITDGKTYVMLDGAEILTPITTVTNVKDGDRVTVQIKDHAATITGNLSSPSANSTDLALVDKKIAEFETVIAKSITTEQLNAERARIDELIAKDVIIEGKLTANEATINRLSSTMITTETLRAEIAQIGIATIEDLNAINAKIYNLEGVYGQFEALTVGRLDALEGRFDTLEADFATVEYLEANYATIDELDAVSGNINILTSDVADINTLIFGSASGNVIHSNFANAVVAQLGNAQIKSAMIESIAADKITAGDIITNNVKVKSADGSLIISDETMQISDENRVRVQIGKDAAGDYSINIWDESGNLMFNKGGITDKAIKEAIIRNDMVADNANISADKLDIESLFNVINEDGSHTLKSSKIMMDDEGQTLQVSFGQITTKVEEAKSAVDNLEIGGRNLIPASRFSSDNTFSKGSLVKFQNNGMYIYRQTNPYIYHGITLLENLVIGEQYTFSCRVAESSNSNYHFFRLGNLKSADNAYQYYTKKISPTGDDEKIVVTFTATSNLLTMVLYPYASSTAPTETVWMYAYDIKLEKGTKATDWTPAPEDVDSAISSADSKASTAQSTADKAQSDIDNLEIGGRNLIIAANVTKGEYINIDGTDISHHLNISTDFIAVKPGDSLILQYWQPANSQVGAYRAWTNQFIWYDINMVYMGGYTAKYFSDEHIVFKSIVPEGCYYVRSSYQLPQGSVSDITDWDNSSPFKWKLEKGNRATDWTPAPEDVEAEITTLTETVTSQGTDISVMQGQISSKIWQQDIITAVESIEVGGRNYYSVNTPYTVFPSTDTNGNTYNSVIQRPMESCPNGFYIVGDQTGKGGVRLKNVITSNGFWTVSFWVRGGQNVAIYFQIDLCDGPRQSVGTTNDNSWKKIELTFEVTNYTSDVYNFIDFSNIQWAYFYIKDFKVEKGTVATDWTPAPEDMEGEVKNLTTQYSELNQDLNEISATVGKHETDISGTKSQLTEVVANLDGFKSEVSKTYTTKSAFDALEIGGRNLFKGYGEEEIRLADYQGVGSFSQFKDCLTFNPCETVGETYTISFWAKSPNGTTTLAVYNSNSNPRHFYFHTGSLWTLNAEWQYIKFTFYNSDRGSSYSDDNCNRLEFYAASQMGVLVKKIKVEKGTKATDWTPAPEDVDAQIVEAKNTVIQQTSDAISAKASKQEVTDAINGIEIGGRNLIYNSNFSKEFDGWTNRGVTRSIIDDTTYGKVLRFYTTAPGDGNHRFYPDTAKFTHVANETYTLSFMAKADVSTTLESNVGTHSDRRQYNIITSWQKFTHTYTTTSSGSLTFWPVEANVNIYITNIKLEKGNKATDWSPAPEDITSDMAELKITAESIQGEVSNANGEISNLKQTASDLTFRLDNTVVGGRNYLLNGNLAKVSNSPNTTNKHGNVYAQHFGGYNPGLANPTTIYHAHIDTDTFGYNVYEFNESDGSRNWKAIQQEVAPRLEEGKKYRLSIDVYATAEGTRLHGGFYYRKKGKTDMQFHSGRYDIPSSKISVGKWSRVSVEVPHPVDFDSSSILFYIYAYEFSSNAILYIKNISLNSTDSTTDWTPAPEDIDSSISEVDSKATNAQSTANTANATANTAIDRTTLKDTRDVNQSPAWYITNYPRQTVIEFKTSSVIGLSGGQFCTLETTVPWANNSGGYPKQVAKVDTKKYYRVGLSDTTWSSWVNEAATATNYLNLSQNGLIIGDYTASSLGRNILIGSETIEFRNNTNPLARYGANKIELGLSGDTNTSVSFCGDEFIFGYDTDYSMWSVKSKNELIIQAPTELSLLSYARASSTTSSMCEINMTTHDGLTPLLRLYTTDQINNDITHSCINIGSDYIDMYGVAGSNTVQITLLPFQNRINILSGSIDSTGEYITVNPNGFRIAYGSYGSFIRNDGDSTYFLLTNSGDIYGNWNTLRPLAIKNSTGNISMGHNLSVSGTISEGGTALSSKYSPLSHNHDDRYYASGSHMHASSLTIGTSDPLIYCDDGQHLRFRWLSGGAYRYMAMEDLYNLGWGYTSSSGINSNASTFNINTSANRNGVTVSGNFRPKVDDNMSCGTSGYKWTKLYSTSGSIGTSDEREKDILSNASLEDYSDLFMDIKPIIFRWKSGSDKQIYFGVGAQTLERQFKEHGFDPSLYGIIEHDELEEPTALGLTDRYGMNYQNLQMLTLMQTQKNTRELEKLKEINTNLQAQVETLRDIVMQMYHEFYVLKNTTH